MSRLGLDRQLEPFQVLGVSKAARAFKLSRWPQPHPMLFSYSPNHTARTELGPFGLALNLLLRALSLRPLPPSFNYY